MDPPNKRRRLAPKVAEPPPPPPPQQQQQQPPPSAAPSTTKATIVAAAAPQTSSTTAAAATAPVVPVAAISSSAATPQQGQYPTEQARPLYPSQEAPPPERHEFESFARHLQDAAMYIYGKMQRRPPYKNASVLLIRWEDDTATERDLVGLENVFREKYHYHTDKWAIPTCANPSIKLSVQMASFIEARNDHLLIIYYAGHSYVGPDKEVYWASNPREDASRLKWGGVRCLFEDAQSDILLLLDTCAVHDSPHAGSHGTKQAIAAYSPGQQASEHASTSFTSYLAESLYNLSSFGRPYTVQRLYDEIMRLRQRDIPSRALNGGTSKTHPPAERTPTFFTLTPGKTEHIALSPLPQTPPPSAQDAFGASGQSASRGIPFVSGPVPDLTFDEARVLVCTTFVGDASADMVSYNQWLQNSPPLAKKISVEGMFLGPPTMLLVSMPLSVWNVVQHDKVCCFLGYINSHNMIELYKGLVQSTPPPRASIDTSTIVAQQKPSHDGRGLVEASITAANGHYNKRRHETIAPQASSYSTPSVRQEPPARNPLPNSAPVSAVISPGSSLRHDVDSAEMKEAAEQLKALSHVRHTSDSAVSAGGLSDTRSGRSPSSNETSHAVESMNTSVPPARKPLAKAQPKYDTRCTLCSHAPFKDSSSLRKHIAAAHTRPFPCAFSFSGCTSTFGSKNEWKRHIASQHLCLQYYRCSQCPSSAVEGKGNEFNRKDLFTQHLRRMHAPFAIKKALTKGDSKLQADWDSHVKEMQVSCLVTRREPPQHVACPKPDCLKEFEGNIAWDEWTEHVGRHMEKGDGLKIGVDGLLAKWALDEGIIERVKGDEYRFASQEDTNAFTMRRDSTMNNSFVSDGPKLPRLVPKPDDRADDSSSEDSKSEADESSNTSRNVSVSLNPKEQTPAQTPNQTEVQAEGEDPDSIVVATSTAAGHDRMDTDD